MGNESPLIVDYYTDVLCVWAWIAQHRMDELEKEQGEKISIRHHCVDVFGDTKTRIGEGWSDRGAYEGFAEHVRESASPFEYAPVNPAIWRDTRPFSSATAHQVLKAVELLASAEDSRKLADVFRKCFFVDALDIGDRRVTIEIAQQAGFDPGELGRLVDSGEALAFLMGDYARAKELGLRGSPSLVLNSGRQVLYGNVGYRILNANIEELLNSPPCEASWC